MLFRRVVEQRDRHIGTGVVVEHCPDDLASSVSGPEDNHRFAVARFDRRRSRLELKPTNAAKTEHQTEGGERHQHVYRHGEADRLRNYLQQRQGDRGACDYAGHSYCFIEAREAPTTLIQASQQSERDVARRRKASDHKSMTQRGAVRYSTDTKRQTPDDDIGEKAKGEGARECWQRAPRGR